MAKTKRNIRLSKVAREFNVGTSTIVDFLSKKGHEIQSNPNTKITPEMYELICQEYQSEKSVKEESRKIGLGIPQKKALSLEDSGEEQDDEFEEEEEEQEEEPEEELIIKSKSLTGPEKSTKAKEKEKEEPIEEEKPSKKEETKVEKKEPKVLGTVDLSSFDKKGKKEEASKEKDEPGEEKIGKEPAKKEKVEEEKVVEEKVEEDTGDKKTKPGKDKDEADENENNLRVLGKIDLDTINTKTRPEKKAKPAKKKKAEEEKTPAKQKTTESKEDSQKDKKKLETKEEQEKKKAQEETKPQEEKKEGQREEKPAAKPQTELKKETTKETTPAKEVTQDETEKVESEEEKETFLKTEYQKLDGPTIVGKMKLEDKTPPKKKEKRKPEQKSKPKPKQKAKGGTKPGAKGDEKAKPVASSSEDKKPKKRKRRRIKKDNAPVSVKQNRDRGKKKTSKQTRERYEPSEEEVQKQIKETLARLSGGGKSKASKYRRKKRELISKNLKEEQEKQEKEKTVLKATEFISANELANMMDVPVNDVISKCMELGMFVSINQRLDAETITIVADEFGYTVDFISAEDQEKAELEEIAEDEWEDDKERAPIVTVMGHVDHGKTKLLDHIRKTNIIAGEAGGITQHIGAYEVTLDGNKKITFLDTPGHEAFTAMRARGAKITDVAIIVVAADDSVMPQTVEAINHAQAADVPIIIAINKIDKPQANPEKVKEELSKMNILVEDWGGKYQCQEISAKQGINIEPLLEKVLLEAEMQELKANYERPAKGTILESSLDRGRGYVAKLLVQNGNLKIGDVVLAGSHYGRVKAMYNERNQQVDSVGPSQPVLLLGLNGAPQAGDIFTVTHDEHEAKDIATKRQQLQREQGIRTQKHVTLDEIGRRIAIGDFQELNIIVKGDVDGSIEALSDALLKLSTQEVQVNVIHKSVGQVTETDVLLASASNAIIIGFQVRPSVNARKLAEKEQIDIRMYSVIYSAINEIKSAIEGMLSPEIEEKIVCNIEVRDIFKITKVGTVAGCMVLDGKIHRNTKVRVIRDGIVVYTGFLGSLKRYKDDVKEVSAGYECGLNIENFNDIKVGDIIEGYEEVEVKRKLE